MTVIVPAVFFILVLSGLALRANIRLRGEDRLPMQWWFTGEVTWSAPRPIALAFIPALALLTFASLIILLFYMQARSGQEGMVLPTLIGIGSMFLAIQILHLWLIEKTVHGNGS
jgi:hypothetical protein